MLFYYIHTGESDGVLDCELLRGYPVEDCYVVGRSIDDRCDVLGCLDDASHRHESEDHCTWGEVNLLMCNLTPGLLRDAARNVY